MAEEKQDDLLEEESAKDGAKGEEVQPKKGLTTSLLVKVAIGLTVLLIALIVAFFLLSSSPETDSEASENTEISETTPEATAEVMTDDVATVTPESGTIELPPLAETTPPAETNSAPDNNTATAVVTTPTSPAPSGNASAEDKLLSEFVALQKQLNAMQQENAKLIQRVEELNKESETLRTRLPQSTSSNISYTNDEQVVNTDDVPLYYRENRYANTPQPELKPQWGEFQQPNTQQR